MKFFFGEVGLNADIDRHRKMEKELKDKISELESQENRDEFQERYLLTYRNLLNQLWESKAKVVENIGRNK